MTPLVQYQGYGLPLYCLKTINTLEPRPQRSHGLHFTTTGNRVQFIAPFTVYGKHILLHYTTGGCEVYRQNNVDSWGGHRKQRQHDSRHAPLVVQRRAFGFVALAVAERRQSSEALHGKQASNIAKYMSGHHVRQMSARVRAINTLSPFGKQPGSCGGEFSIHVPYYPGTP